MRSCSGVNFVAILADSFHSYPVDNGCLPNLELLPRKWLVLVLNRVDFDGVRREGSQ
jgi:hypothetical protein